MDNNSSHPPLIVSKIRSNHTYQEVWDLQTHLQQKLIKAKRSGVENHPSYMLLCEHAPVYTLGKSGSMDHLKRSEEELEREQMEFFKINRGGDITYHGPGQSTGYFILDLDNWYHDLHRYVRDIEEVVIRTLSDWGISGTRVDGLTGVWLLPNVTELGLGPYRKICAIGIHMSRWVSMHGYGLNVNTNLEHFDNIIPCGIADQNKTVTSMAAEIGKPVDITEVEGAILGHFVEVFGAEVVAS